jgi:methyl-accepting chemotaxis protein
MIAILFLSFLLIGIVIFGLILRLGNNYERSELSAISLKGEWLAGFLSEKGRIGVSVGNSALLDIASVSAQEDPGVIYMVFYNQSGEPVFKYFNQGLLYEDFTFPPLPESTRIQVRPLSPHDGTAVMDFSKPIRTKPFVGPGGSPEQDGKGSPQNLTKTLGWVRVGISTQHIYEMKSSILTIGLWVMALLVAMDVIITVFLWRMIAKPVLAMADAAQRLGRGELKTGIETDSKDEVGMLARSLNEMTKNIKEQIGRTNSMIDGIKGTIDLINSTSTHLYSISAQQSSGATEQAASVYQASSTSKEIAASATRIADTAEQVASYARQTSTASDQGKEELSGAINQVKDMSDKTEEVATRMVELGEKSQKIGGIIDIINEISEQTNLLSLNAAIEAVGAGEAGKRFSVVAQEIRRLAGKTLESTDVVRQIIEEIQAATNSAVMETEQSTKSALEALSIIEHLNQSFQNIMDFVEQTLKASTEINLSTRQQTTACEQMVATIMEVSEVASEVEKGAKETERAVEKLRKLSEEIKNSAELEIENA